MFYVHSESLIVIQNNDVTSFQLSWSIDFNTFYCFFYTLIFLANGVNDKQSIKQDFFD